MKEELMTNIEQEMMSVLDNAQMEQLKRVLKHCFYNVKVTFEEQDIEKELNNNKLLGSFLSSKHIEGCSAKSLKYYRSTIENMYKSVKKHVKHITTDDLREYLDIYQKKNNASKVTIDNVRRIFSSYLLGLRMKITLLRVLLEESIKLKQVNQ